MIWFGRQTFICRYCIQRAPGKTRRALLGERVWESNPPKRFCAIHTGFEDRETHRRPSAPIYHLYIPFWDVRIAVPNGQPHRVEMLQQRLRIFSGDAERIAQTGKRDPGGTGRARNSARGHIRAL